MKIPTRHRHSLFSFATVLLALALAFALPALAGPGCGNCCKGKGMGKGRAAQTVTPDNHHDLIQALLDDHQAVTREVREIEGGVETRTTSEDPEVVANVRQHVAQMKTRLESGQPVRHWDPTFVELFKHHDKIVMEIEDIPGGVRVRETSDDPQVTKLIRQHALRGVSEFVARGRARASEPTPLPEGYAPVE